MRDLAGPTGMLQGMAQPRRWVEALTAEVTTTPPYATGTAGRLPTGLWGVRLTLADHHLYPMQVMLVPYPERVRMSLWTQAWGKTAPARDAQYLALMTVARQLIGAVQRSDPTHVVLLLPPHSSANLPTRTTRERRDHDPNPTPGRTDAVDGR